MITTLPKRKYASDLIIVDENLSREFYNKLREKASYHEVLIVNGCDNRLGLHKGMPDKEIRRIAMENGHAYIVSKNLFDTEEDGFRRYSQMIYIPLNCLDETEEVVDRELDLVFRRLYGDGYLDYGKYLSK
jgi:hypothetical protein